MKPWAVRYRAVGGLLAGLVLSIVGIQGGCGREELDLRPRDTGGRGQTGGGGTGGMEATGGAGATGGFPSGGFSTGGRATGGAPSGGTGTGGFATGGFATGGFATGGIRTGGAGSGGSFTGGKQATGGFATGGIGSGGTRTGGTGTGGFATGGVSTGGLPTGGFGAGGVPTGGTGMGGAVATCVWGQSVACACADGNPGAQVCQSNGMYAPCVCADSPYKVLAQGIVGSWIGLRSSPWTPMEKVAVTFEADGHYKAVCAQSSCAAVVFYYGVDDDLPTKKYAVRDIMADGAGRGDIVIAFGPRMDSTQNGTLDEIILSPDKQHLTFRFWPTWISMIGPLTFDLARQK